jgi:hypothetical protein
MSALVPPRINKLSAAPLAEVLGRCDLPPEALRVVGDFEEIGGVIRVLTETGFALEATRVFAHALPRREAVWWACMCAQHTAPEALPALDLAARQAAELWVRTQADEPRRLAMEKARAAGMQGPDAWAGVAAFWSGPSIMPPGSPAVPPPPHLTGVAVAGAVALSSVRLTPKRRGERLERFLQAAWDIAAGGSGRLPEEGA